MKDKILISLILTLAVFSLFSTISFAALLPIRQFDFQPAGAVNLEAGFTEVNRTLIYSPSVGYGWLTSPSSDFDRGMGSDLERDFIYDSVDRYFYVDLPNGQYTVTVLLGDKGAAHDRMSIDAEAGPWDLYDINTSAGEVKVLNFTTTISGNQLDVLFRDMGGSNPHWVCEGLIIWKNVSTIYVPGNFSTIQAAVDAADSGDTIYVGNGTYNENQIVINKPLTIIGENPDATIIDGSSVTSLTQPGLVRITDAGNVIFSGFTLKNAGVDPTETGNSGMPVRFGIYATSSTSGNTYTISNNKIFGTNDENDEEDYAVYASGGKENFIFTNNTVTQTGANPILIEQHIGSTEISYNIIDVGPWGSTAIFYLIHDGLNVTTLQKVSHNTIDVGTGTIFDYDHRASGVTFASAFGSTVGRFTNVEVSDNIIYNLKANRRGIDLWNAALGDGSAGDINSAKILRNTITGVSSGVGSRGITLLGMANNSDIESNTITNVEKGFWGTDNKVGGTHYSSGVLIKNNIFANNSYGLILDAGSNTTITGNTVYGNTFEGIQLNGTSYSVSNNTISQNTIYGNKRHGILFVSNANNNTVVNNVVYNNTYAAIVLWSPSAPYPSNNLIYLNKIFKGSAGTSYTAWDNSLTNKWNTTIGNFWSDYSTNPGYPPYYNILQGLAGNIDYRPIVPSEVWVDDNYCNGCPNDGHVWMYDAYNKIQDGIDAAVGSIVHVRSGNYTENIFIDKPVKLIGEDRSTTIIDANFAGDGIDVTSDNVTISGFTVRNADNGVAENYAGIWFVKVGGLINGNVTDNIIENSNIGIGVGPMASPNQPYNNFYIFKNLIRNITKTGIFGDGQILNSWLIDNNEVKDVWHEHGIRIDAGNNSIIRNNLIHNTSLAGIFLTSMTDVVSCLSNNQIYGNEIWAMNGSYISPTTGDGIVIRGSNSCNENNYVRDNKIHNNLRAGITIGDYLETANKNTIYHNVIYSNEKGVLLASLADSNLVDKNNIYGNQHGIWVEGDSNNITNNYIHDNILIDTGIDLTNTTNNNRIFYNSFVNNGDPQAVDNGTSNQWDDGKKGNYWSDLRYNVNYPTNYMISGTGSIDHYPTGPRLASASFSSRGGTLEKFMDKTSFTSTTLSMSGYITDSNKKLSGYISVQVRATSTDGNITYGYLYFRPTKLYTFNGKLVSVEGTGTLRGYMRGSGFSRYTTVRQNLDSIKVDVNSVTDKASVVGKLGVDEKLNITDMDLTGFRFYELVTPIIFR